ncbi:MAG: type I methionyl aminopeptidase [Patescibacteria group bacterium]
MILNPQQQEHMRTGGKILAGILHELARMVQPGMRTQQLEDAAREGIRAAGVQPSFLGYGEFPAVLCVSINEQAVHGVPGDYEIHTGDLVKLDFGIVHEGLHTDTAVTVIAGLTDANKKEWQERVTLSRVTREALYAGIAQARVGHTVGHIGAAVQEHAEKHGFTILKDLGGHGIGTRLHEEPFVPNHGVAGTGDVLVPGMALAIEPILATGTTKTKDGEDGFVYITKNGSLSAHFEHTIIVTEGAPIIVTEQS